MFLSKWYTKFRKISLFIMKHLLKLYYLHIYVNPVLLIIYITNKKVGLNINSNIRPEQRNFTKVTVNFLPLTWAAFKTLGFFE